MWPWPNHMFPFFISLDHVTHLLRPQIGSSAACHSPDRKKCRHFPNKAIISPAHWQPSTLAPWFWKTRYLATVRPDKPSLQQIYAKSLCIKIIILAKKICIIKRSNLPSNIFKKLLSFRRYSQYCKMSCLFSLWMSQGTILNDGKGNLTR